MEKIKARGWNRSEDKERYNKGESYLKKKNERKRKKKKHLN